ncbi:type VII secretion protein EssC [Convivina praedatoris]|uniref:Type VII secretion system protein EssC n=1 Tax=Convivina praedatoris TaxID=2880963 RepID=A0ABM9D2J0_9LACO|nr:type VII secretion protein EssC [Convivina sp. LMG 32447]CAH1855358.1 Type VII secretion system protein EssC [Convivina sp. LMG 32447]CAH1856029.1 Type VII secretion system protein EssC [Convivina sp. LMG 32447]
MQKTVSLFKIYYWDTVFWQGELSVAQWEEKLPNGQRIWLKQGQVQLNEDGPIELGQVISLSTSYLVVLVANEQMILSFVQPSNQRLLISGKNVPGHLVGTNEFFNQIVYVKPAIKVGTYHLQIPEIAANKQIYLNGSAISVGGDEIDFEPGNTLFCNGLLIINEGPYWQIMVVCGCCRYDSKCLIPQQGMQWSPKDFPYHYPSSRFVLAPPSSDDIELKTPQQMTAESNTGLWRTIIPVLGMLLASGVLVLVSHQNPVMMITMIIMAVVTIGLSLTEYFKNKRQQKRRQQADEKNYWQYLYRQCARLSYLQRQESRRLADCYPDLKQLMTMADTYDSRIYERVPNKDDFLKIRVGTGRITSQYRFQYQDDELKTTGIWVKIRQAVLKPQQHLFQAPITLNLQTNVGLVAEYAIARLIVKNWLLQLAFFHSYQHVQFLVLLPSEDQKFWWPLRWLKQLDLSEIDLRGFVYDEQSQYLVLTTFHQLLNQRRARVQATSGNKVKFAIHYLLVVLEDKWLLQHPIYPLLLSDLSSLSISIVWVQGNKGQLPSELDTVLTYNNTLVGEMLTKGDAYQQSFAALSLTNSFCQRRFIRNLANLIHPQLEQQSLPAMVSFLDIYRVSQVKELNIAQRWQRANPSQSLAVPLGLGRSNQVLELDLHESQHGPHSLIAGTTGSGKSELLQSYLLSLAVNFSPEDVGFIAIDFKGGGLANLLAECPHLLGSITNLDGSLLNRTLLSIRAELHKRQKLFKKYHVNNINDYMASYRAKQKGTNSVSLIASPQKPLPHLFLVADEFAELKAQKPEFMQKLISVARIGRSLGIHLVLATQKPSGIVDEQIWSNMNCKLALKVQNQADSNEILKTPDAADIVEAGRAYLQVGNNERYELFQSAWSGAKYTFKASNPMSIADDIWLINRFGQNQAIPPLKNTTQLWKKASGSQLHAILGEIQRVQTQSRYQLPDKPWLPPLPRKINLDSIDYEQNWQKNLNLKAPMGWIDLPDQQQQIIWYFDIQRAGHTIILGSVGTGKSTFLQTLIMTLAQQNNPRLLQFNLFDFSHNGLYIFNSLPHVRDVCSLENSEKCLKFMRYLCQELNRRQTLLQQHQATNWQQYCQQVKEPEVIQVIVFDGYDNLHGAGFEQEFEQGLVQLLKAGSRLGMYLLLTGLRENSLRLALSSLVSNKLIYYLNDEHSVYHLLGGDRLPVENIPGRLQLKYKGRVVTAQTGLVATGKDSLSTIRAMVKSLEHAWSGAVPAAIPMVPRHLSFKKFWTQSAIQLMLKKGQLPIGLELEEAKICSLSLTQEGVYSLIYDGLLQRDSLHQIILQTLTSLPKNWQGLVLDVNDELRDCSLKQRIARQRIVAKIQDLIAIVKQGLVKNDFDYYRVIYITDLQELIQLGIQVKQLELLFQQGKKFGIHLLLMVNSTYLNTNYDPISRLVKNNFTVGLYGGVLSNQNYLSVPFSGQLTQLADDEMYYINHRQVQRIKLAT